MNKSDKLEKKIKNYKRTSNKVKLPTPRLSLLKDLDKLLRYLNSIYLNVERAKRFMFEDIVQTATDLYCICTKFNYSNLNNEREKYIRRDLELEALTLVRKLQTIVIIGYDNRLYGNKAHYNIHNLLASITKKLNSLVKNDYKRIYNIE